MRKIKFEKGKIYHVFSRGVEKRDIFTNDADRWRFLQGMYLFNDENATTNLLYRLERDKGAATFTTLRNLMFSRQQERKPLVRIMADCLMPNHFHLILEEIKDGGISHFMHRLGTGYVKFFNKKYDRVGGLFQGRFKAVPVEQELYLKYLLIYINVVNPGQLVEPELKEIGARDMDTIMRFAEGYPWSTHQEYLGKRKSTIIDKGILGELFPDPSEYQKFAADVLSGKKFIEISHLILE